MLRVFVIFFGLVKDFSVLDRLVNKAVSDFHGFSVGNKKPEKIITNT